METENQDVTARNAEYKTGRNWAMGLAAAVYLGVVLSATVIFISFVLDAFPENAYLSRIVMTVAGVMVGGSMIAFPLALHLWAVEKIHRRVTIALYYVEMLIIAVNSIVAFTALLNKNAALSQTPEWVLLYEPFSIGAIVYTLAAWGTILLLDPAHKRKAKDQANQEKFEDKISNRMAEFLDSAEGEDVIMDIATRRAYEEFSPERFKTGKKSWGTKGKKALPESEAPKLPAPADETPRVGHRTVEIPEDVYKQLLQDANIPKSDNGKHPVDPTTRQR